MTGPHRLIAAGDGPGLEALSALLGTAVTASEGAPWGTSGRTEIVTTDRGDQLVIQRYRTSPAARTRIRVARTLSGALADAGIPTPRLVAADVGRTRAFVVSTFVAGRPGAALLDVPDEAALLGRLMGDLACRLATVPAKTAHLPTTWAHPVRLARVAAGWLEASGSAVNDSFDPARARSIRAALSASLARLPLLFADRPAVVAHGDLVPVNVIVDRRSIVAVLDWEFARLADPLFDPAWWAWIVSYHHADAFAVAWPAFLAAARVQMTALVAERLWALAGLRLLEAVAMAVLAGDDVRAGRWLDHLRRWAEESFPG